MTAATGDTWYADSLQAIEQALYGKTEFPVDVDLGGQRPAGVARPQSTAFHRQRRGRPGGGLGHRDCAGARLPTDH